LNVFNIFKNKNYLKTKSLTQLEPSKGRLGSITIEV